MAPPGLSPGQRFAGRYEVIRCLKAGGMGAVYEVLDHTTKRRRALKVMHPELLADAHQRERFQREATVAANVESEHIVETFDAGVDEPTGIPFLAMELLDGSDLGAEVARRGRLPPDEVAALLGQAALALERTHAKGIVHRDLKPENLFVVRRDDGAARLKILDFGIAKVVGPREGEAKTTQSVGTPLYMAPEQLTGDGAIGPAADLYALGQVAYTLLVGVEYWRDEHVSGDAVVAKLLKIAKGAREPASARARARGVELPDAFDAWFGRATAVSAARRFESAPAMVRALGRAFAIPSVSTPRASGEPAAEVGGGAPPAPTEATPPDPPSRSLVPNREARRVIPGSTLERRLVVAIPIAVALALAWIVVGAGAEPGAAAPDPVAPSAAPSASGAPAPLAPPEASPPDPSATPAAAGSAATAEADAEARPARSAPRASSAARASADPPPRVAPLAPPRPGLVVDPPF